MPVSVFYSSMETFGEEWVQARVEQTRATWNDAASGPAPQGQVYDRAEQERREHAYDEALNALEADLNSQFAGEDLENQLMSSFGLFAARSLDLENEAIQLLTKAFLPVGTGLACWARQFDAELSMPEIIQAARNAWTACGLQPLLDVPVELTRSIAGYSLMYPYNDNLLDDRTISTDSKREFSARFRRRLLGEQFPVCDKRERALARLVALVETQYSRDAFPGVYECLLAIHLAQEQSLRQLGMRLDVDEILRLTCAKGGTSVLTDACLGRGHLTAEESSFAFQWGVLLQLGDDLQDLRDDQSRGSQTLFSNAAAAGQPLDLSGLQLLRFSQRVGDSMDRLPNGSGTLKRLLKMSWRSLIIRAMAEAHESFTPGFLAQMEQFSPFRFAFLRERNHGLNGRRGLYAVLFERLLDGRMAQTL